ncbi:MAG TPA: RNA polymerase sigma factor [Gemmatimonadales bacterium]|nr:RNA polymerase sigma factor [Gemmatimonadales bacterium]
MTDSYLIAQVLAGDAAAERSMYDAHVDRVWRLVYRIVGDADQAADCVQETFIRAFSRLASFRGESSLATWIGSIAITTALNAVRSLKRRGARMVSIEDAPESGAEPRNGDPDLKQKLHAAIDALPKGYRTVFLMHDVEGYTHEEIGAALSIASGTSKAQLSRARARLRSALGAFAPES